MNLHCRESYLWASLLMTQSTAWASAFACLRGCRRLEFGKAWSSPHHSASTSGSCPCHLHVRLDSLFWEYHSGSSAWNLRSWDQLSHLLWSECDAYQAQLHALLYWESALVYSAQRSRFYQVSLPYCCHHLGCQFIVAAIQLTLSYGAGEKGRGQVRDFGGRALFWLCWRSGDGIAWRSRWVDHCSTWNSSDSICCLTAPLRGITSGSWNPYLRCSSRLDACSFDSFWAASSVWMNSHPS